MSVLFGRKTAGTKFSTINYARGLVISLYLVSWAFSFMATHLVQTNDYNAVSCTMSVYSCIFLYAASKIIIYLFLMEKVYVVTAVGAARMQFMLYKVNLALMVPYFGVIALMLIYRVAELDTSGKCLIGLLRPAALSLILYDMFLSVWLTLLFIRPLMSSKSMLQGPSKGRLRDVARKTLVGAVIALILSSANVFTLVYFGGYERGLICLSSCTADVTLNAITIHWATSRATSNTPMVNPTQGETAAALTGRDRVEARSKGPSRLMSKMPAQYEQDFDKSSYELVTVDKSVRIETPPSPLPSRPPSLSLAADQGKVDESPACATVEAYVDRFYPPSPSLSVSPSEKSSSGSSP
ncbi:hypothetical protein BGW38_006709 [Lunasporangiospora selenospora]|uniref:Transmembrane protein n=1 Tax=Lunasporangiospora selenospora TaxID=979761 RepID=A0A9P6FM92_9FUNG|nr:hypothetical protein BGW38_006709 [Lunasporangiospora selenospora]